MSVINITALIKNRTLKIKRLTAEIESLCDARAEMVRIHAEAVRAQESRMGTADYSRARSRAREMYTRLQDTTGEVLNDLTGFPEHWIIQ